MSGLIPEGYTLLESQFHSALVKAGREWEEKPVNGAKGIELREWKREGWTYHAKGKHDVHLSHGAVAKSYYCFTQVFGCRAARVKELPLSLSRPSSALPTSQPGHSS